eukprot:1161496-Pelagomonas_calceolata.AAC.2
MWRKADELIPRFLGSRLVNWVPFHANLMRGGVSVSKTRGKCHGQMAVSSRWHGGRSAANQAKLSGKCAGFEEEQLSPHNSAAAQLMAAVSVQNLKRSSRLVLFLGGRGLGSRQDRNSHAPSNRKLIWPPDRRWAGKGKKNDLSSSLCCAPDRLIPICGIMGQHDLWLGCGGIKYV